DRCLGRLSKADAWASLPDWLKMENPTCAAGDARSGGGSGEMTRRKREITGLASELTERNPIWWQPVGPDTATNFPCAGFWHRKAKHESHTEVAGRGTAAAQPR